eukprot:6546876-Alexandrium_andersonii.AAC.1
MAPPMTSPSARSTDEAREGQTLRHCFVRSPYPPASVRTEGRVFWGPRRRGPYVFRIRKQ